jgi:hypothetical protein
VLQKSLCMASTVCACLPCVTAPVGTSVHWCKLEAKFVTGSMLAEPAWLPALWQTRTKHARVPKLPPSSLLLTRLPEGRLESASGDVQAHGRRTGAAHGSKRVPRLPAG